MIGGPDFERLELLQSYDGRDSKGAFGAGICRKNGEEGLIERLMEDGFDSGKGWF